MTVRLLIIPAILLLQCFPAHGILPLRDQWAAANRALVRNQPEIAFQLFQEFNHWYADEEVTQSPKFREKWYRLWGLSCLQAGSIEQGISLLETWLEENPGQDRFRAFIRFQLASAYLLYGNPEKAIHHWTQFMSEYPDLPECALVRWLYADLLISQGMFDDAITHFQVLVDNDQLSESSTALAKSALALALLSTGRHEESFRQLESESGTPAARIWKAILSPVLTDHFLRADQPDLAKDTSKWFESAGFLQSEFSKIQSRGSGQRGSVREMIWNTHWKNQMDKASASIQSMLESGLSQSQLYQLRIRALQEGEASMDAFVLTRFLLETTQEDLIEIREIAYAQFIESCIALGYWDRADEAIRQFLREYPDNPELPNILFLQARTSAAQKAWYEAVIQIDRLISRFPEHKSIRSWKVTGANWRMNIGKVREALDMLVQLEPDCPDTWLSYLRLEQARCHERLNQSNEAESLYNWILSSERISMIAEQSAVSLMKIYLSRLDWQAFQSVWNSFQEIFSHSDGLSTGELLLASFHEFSNKIDAAINVYWKVSQRNLPQSDHAHLQLSRLHAGRNDFQALRKHALEWIQQTQSHTGDIPDQALRDCLLYQERMASPSLPESLVHTLIDRLSSDDARFPCMRFLSILESQWIDYSELLQIEATPFPEWIESFAGDQYANERTRAWSALVLYSAEMLDRENRSDSADTKRIQILTTIDPANLNQYGLFQIASTAHKYDFPECESLLNSYIRNYDSAGQVPQCLSMLADLYHRSGNNEDAMHLLETITLRWPDSAIFNVSALKLAHWQFEAKLLTLADQSIEAILQKGDLLPRQIAQALLLRAKIDKKAGRHERLLLNCERILTLYPDFHDISQEARHIINSSQNA